MIWGKLTACDQPLDDVKLIGEKTTRHGENVTCEQCQAAFEKADVTEAEATAVADVKEKLAAALTWHLRIAPATALCGATSENIVKTDKFTHDISEMSCDKCIAVFNTARRVKFEKPMNASDVVVAEAVDYDVDPADPAPILLLPMPLAAVAADGENI